ncbi:Eukaryotic translation initiation factor 3 subunit E [Cricetulus griseus]|uniref:Eukaryotic translation initiation factor 3 subunit E n=1 Tax=Cricetulus griseus TaxID=10029 RepID=G3HAU1_CRIGR|nr:Eukaryotic translation initiation factor 3 subunit E [Cricetulus griseus]
MVDFAMDVYKNLYSDDIPHALREKRTTVVAQLKQLQAETEPIVKMFEDPETTRQMQSTRYLNAIQTMCPHILRYLTTAVITNKDVRKRRQVLKDLVKVIQQESYTYKDPITEFVECLYVNFDFDGAQKKLRECESVLVNDFFLVACLEDFIENARLFIFETFCRIHQCISINMLADKLNMTPEEAERWIVNLIRNARLDAKIDSKLGHVVMGNNAVSPYQQVIEKTKSLSFRSQMLAMNIEKKLNQNSRSEAPNWATQDSGFY